MNHVVKFFVFFFVPRKKKTHHGRVFPRQQPKKPSRGETPEAPQSTARRSDAWKHPKGVWV
jgi:hypothetical protein